MNIAFFPKTDTGRIRSENQDSYGFLEDGRLFVVCDGMGGGAAGDFASRAAVQVLLKAFEKLQLNDLEHLVGETTNYTEPSRRLFASIRLANRALSNLAIKYPKLKGMGTTIVACLVDKERNLLHIFHVGDSRLYRLRGSEMDLLTYDHSKVNELIELGKMTESDAKHSEIQSMITRALGTQPVVRIDYKVVQIAEGDCFMMCTDGLNGEIEDAQIREIFLANYDSLPRLCSELINAANAAGGRDNTTVIAFRANNHIPAEAPKEPLSKDTDTVYTVEAETPEESEAEDVILRTLIRESGLRIPTSAIETNITAHPIILGILFAVVLVIGVWMVSKLSSVKIFPQREKELVNVANKVCGFSISVRTPTPDQYRSYKASDDAVIRLQLIQDWYKDVSVDTVPLEGATISVVSNAVVVASATVTGKTFNAKLAPGSYDIRLTFPNYKVITEKMESGNIRIPLEYSATLKPVVLIMIPE